MASEQPIDIQSRDEIPDKARSDSISTTASDVSSETLDDESSLDGLLAEPPVIRVSSPNCDTAKIIGSALGHELDNVNLNISVKVNKTSLKGKKVKDESGHKEQTVDVDPHVIGVKAVAKEESDTKKDKDGNYTIDLQFTINMDKFKKGKGHKDRRRRHKSDSEMGNGNGRGQEERGSDDNDLDLGEGAVGGHLSDVIPEEPEGQSASGTPRHSLTCEENGDVSSPRMTRKGMDYLSEYDSGYFDYGKKQTTDLDEEEADAGLPTLRISGSHEDTADTEERELQQQQQQESDDKSKRKSKSYIRKERAKRLKDKFTQPPKLVLRRNSATEFGHSANVQFESDQDSAKPKRRYSITAANEQHKMGSSDEEALDDADTEQIDTLIVLNKLKNFLKKNMPGLKHNGDKQTEQSSRPVVENGEANYTADLDNGVQENLPTNLPSGQSLDTSFTTEDGEHSGEVTPRNVSDTDEDEGMQESLTPRNTSPNLERRCQSRSPNDQPIKLESSGDKLNKQTSERKTRLTRQIAKEDYRITQDVQPSTSLQTNTATPADESMRPGRLADRRQQLHSIPSIEISNENDETVEVVKPKFEDVPKSPKMQRANSESAVSQGLLAPYCKLDMGNGTDSDEVFTLAANRSPHFRGKHGHLRTETLRMDDSGHTRAEIVLDCDHPENLTAEELGITLAEGETLRILPVLVLDAETAESDGGDTEETPEFPHSFAPIGIIPLSDEKLKLTEQELGNITEKAEEILKDTDRGKMFHFVHSPNFHVGRPKAPTVTGTKVLRRAATEAQAERLQTREEPALPVTMRARSPQVNRRALSECGSPRGSPRVGRRQIYKEFFEPTRRITRPENELCSPIEKRHHNVMDNLNQMQFNRQISGEDISTSGLGGYSKDQKFQRRCSRESVGSDSSGDSKEEQKQDRVFVFPPNPMALRNSYRVDSDREDSASGSSGSGKSIGTGDSIRERKKSLEERFKQDGNWPPRPIPPRTLNFTSVTNVREDLQRRLSSDSDSSRPVLDGNKTRNSPGSKVSAFERPPEYTGVKSKFEKLIASDGMQSPTLSRRPESVRGSLTLTKSPQSPKSVDEKTESETKKPEQSLSRRPESVRSSLTLNKSPQFSKSVDEKTESDTKKPEQSWTWKQRELERSKSETGATNKNNSNNRIKSCPPPKTDDDWFMPRFTPKAKEVKQEKEKPRSRDVSPFRDENTDWFFNEIKPEAADQQQSGLTLTVPGSPDARQKRHQWSGTVQQQNREPKGNSALGSTSKSPGAGSKTKTGGNLSLNSNNNARKTRVDDEQDWLFLQKSEAKNAPSSPVQLRKHARAKTSDEPRYGLTIQTTGKHGRSKSSEGPDYGLTLQTSARPRTVSQGSEADEVFVEYPGLSTPRSPSLMRSKSQPHAGADQNPFMDYTPVGRHQPIIIDGRTPPKPQPAPTASSTPRMSKTFSEGQRSKPTPIRGQSSPQSPRPQMSRSTPSQSSMSGLAVRAIANSSSRNSPSTSRDSRDCQGNLELSMASVDSGWYSDRLDSTMSDVFDLNEHDGYSSDTTDTPRASTGRSFFPLYNGRADDSESRDQNIAIETDTAINKLLDDNDGYSSDDELFRQRCIDVFKTLHHEDVVYQQFQKLVRFRQRRISLHKDNFKIIPKKDERNDSDSDGNVAYHV